MKSGRDGYLAADVADAAGIPRDPAERVLEARQRGFRSEGVLHVAQASKDLSRDFLLFMVQRPAGEVFFYVWTPREGLARAFATLPGHDEVVFLDPAQADEGFRRVRAYWEARAAGL